MAAVRGLLKLARRLTQSKGDDRYLTGIWLSTGLSPGFTVGALLPALYYRRMIASDDCGVVETSRQRIPAQHRGWRLSKS
jgi:hypothetical protein